MSQDYIVGLLAADGWTTKYHHKNEDKISYYSALEMKDEQIIADLANYFDKKYTIRHRGETTHYILHMPSATFGEFGALLDTNRTGILNYYLNCKNQGDFVRGLFDGDGSIASHPRSSGGRVGFSVSSRQPEIKEIILDFSQKCCLNASIYLDKRGSGTWYISFNSKNDVNILYHVMYEDSPTIFLKRKKERFHELGFPI